MPELPEVETIARKLRLVLPGKTISAIQQFHPKSFVGDVQLVQNRQITEISRRSKLLRIHLSGGQNLVIHLKMTGQLIYVDEQIKVGGGHPTADWVNTLPSKHTRVALQLDPQANLFFNDQRLFGWIQVVDDQLAQDLAQKYGPDAHQENFTAEYLYPLLQRRSIPIKVALMDNSVVAGVGNIYAAEALNLAQLSPARPAKSLTKNETARLVDASQAVIKRGIELGGTTFDGKYVNTEGMAGKYQSIVRVYGREGQACPNCGGEIKKIKLGGRGSYFCPSCQL